MYVDGGTIEKTFFSEGDVIFREGDPGDAAFIVETGAIGIFKTVEGEDIQIATINMGELFGEMAIIDGSKRMARAVALDDSVVVSIPRAGLEAMLAKQEPFVKTLIEILADNLRSVHEVYMKRPRSIHDYLAAIAFHVEGFRHSLRRNPDADQTGEAGKRIDEIDRHLTAIRGLVAGTVDNRASVLDENAAPAKAPTKAPAGGG